MSTQLGSICNTAGINVGLLSKRVGLPYEEVIAIIDGDKMPRPHTLKRIMHGIEFYTKRTWTDAQAIDLLSESPVALFVEAQRKPRMIDLLAEDARRSNARW